MNKIIIRQVIDLQNQSSAKLREMYEVLFSEAPPYKSTKEHLRPKLAYRLQELALGGISAGTNGIALSSNDLTWFGFLVSDNDFKNVDISGSLKITWLNNNTFRIEQNRSTLKVDGKDLTFNPMVVQWTNEHH